MKKYLSHGKMINANTHTEAHRDKPIEINTIDNLLYNNLHRLMPAVILSSDVQAIVVSISANNSRMLNVPFNVRLQIGS